MGSDMAMERVYYETRAQWEMDGDEQVLAIYRRSSYDGADTEVWRGEPSEHVQTLVCALVGTIPPRPTPVKSLETRVTDWLTDVIGQYNTDFWEESEWREVAREFIDEFNISDSSKEVL